MLNSFDEVLPGTKLRVRADLGDEIASPDSTFQHGINDNMRRYAGKIVTCKKIAASGYVIHIEEDVQYDWHYVWDPNMFECIVENNEKPLIDVLLLEVSDIA